MAYIYLPLHNLVVANTTKQVSSRGTADMLSLEGGSWARKRRCLLENKRLSVGDSARDKAIILFNSCCTHTGCARYRRTGHTQVAKIDKWTSQFGDNPLCFIDKLFQVLCRRNWSAVQLCVDTRRSESRQAAGALGS